jgi:hypothetical protein
MPDTPNTQPDVHPGVNWLLVGMGSKIPTVVDFSQSQT